MKRYNKPNTYFGIAVLLGIVGLSLLYTVYSETVTKYALEAISLCATSVIPSLFPFMVLSNIASKTASVLTGKDSRKTGIAVSVVLGALCGFPVGAASVAAVYKNGVLQKEEAEYLCALCNNTGPAFVIGVIGISFWGSYRLGVMFYICQIASAAIVFALWYNIFGKRRICRSNDFCICVNNTQENKIKPSLSNTLNRSAGIFCNAVSESAVSIIRICGYIVFFKVLCDTIGFLMPKSVISNILYTVISSVLEFTTGAKNSAALGGLIGIALCGFSIGFSGISVIAQSTGIMSRAGLSSAPLFKLKILIGCLCGIMSSVTYKLLPLSDTVIAGKFIYSLSPMRYISAVIIILSAVLFAVQKAKELR